MAYNKHLYNGEDLDKVITQFNKVADMLVEAKIGEEFDYENQIVILNALHKLNNVIYAKNDFIASCNAYKYIIPYSDKFITYITSIISKNIECSEEYYEKVSKFVVTRSSLTECTMKDGSSKQLTMLDYLYTQIYCKQLAIGARYFLNNNIQYLELDKTEKDFPSRERILSPAIWWANQMLLKMLGLKMPNGGRYSDIDPHTIIFSTFPSSGKSYLCNTMNEMFVELDWLIEKSGGVLRVGNEQGNIFRQSRQTMNLIENNKRIFDVYPENMEFVTASTGKYYPFGKSSEEEWGLSGCYFDPSTCVFKTRDSAINSIRCRLGMFDDPSRGQQECNNLQIHKQICDLYNGDFSDRFKKQSDKRIILTGTMFNPCDVFSTEIDKAMSKGYEEDERYRNVFICDGGNTIVIINDCEDDYGHSAYPEFISDEDLQKKKEGLSDYDYHCIWRQKPIPADGLIFAKELLMYYETIDRTELSNYAKSYIDPTRRRASDYFSMPICKYNNVTNTWDLIDIILEQKSSRDLYDKIVNKVIQHNIIELVYEENIDGSMGDMIKKKLEEAGITYCKVKPLYNTVNKMQRILDMADTIKKHIRFPSTKLYNERTQLGFAVRQLTEFNGEKTQHDDLPDSLAGFASMFVIDSQKENRIKGKKRPF